MFPPRSAGCPPAPATRSTRTRRRVVRPRPSCSCCFASSHRVLVSPEAASVRPRCFRKSADYSDRVGRRHPPPCLGCSHDARLRSKSKRLGSAVARELDAARLPRRSTYRRARSGPFRQRKSSTSSGDAASSNVPAKAACELRSRINREQVARRRGFERLVDLGASVVAPVDVAPDAGAPEKSHIVRRRRAGPT